jgi:Zn-dependent protease with chaperone function
MNIAFLGLVATLFDTGPAWAYLDPGTGSMMLQVLLGGIAGALVVGKLYWYRLREFVASRFSAKPGEGAHAKRAKTSSRTELPGE